MNSIGFVATLLAVSIVAFTSIHFYKGVIKRVEFDFFFGNSVKQQVFKVNPLQPPANPKSMVTIATTEIGYSLACVPTENGKKQCAQLAAMLKKKSLHYVELLYKGKEIESFCASSLYDLPNNIQHVCSYQDCNMDNECTPTNVLAIKFSLAGEEKDKCEKVAFQLYYSQNKVHTTFMCGAEKGPDTAPECNENGGSLSTPSQKHWKIEKHLETLCKFDDKESS